jgi:flagellar hook assembly protein FlgD
MKAFLVSIVASLAAPAAAFAGGPTMTVRTVPLGGAMAGERVLAAKTPRFNMVGVHWRGTGAVEFRWRNVAGGWSAWNNADDDIKPDSRSSENRIRGWRFANPAWTGAADAIRFRTTGRVSGLRAYYIWSPPERTPARRIAIANAPPIIPRLSWGADESIRRAAPQYAPAIRYAVVHHTAGSNDYTASQSASIVRGIYLYHVKGNGWNDIGYNFLVDKYGQVFEGRFGGYDKATVGAHAEGFNTGSVGVSVLGSYGSAPVSAAAQTAVEQLLAWRLDVAHIDPASSLTVASGGNPRFPGGVAVNLRAISGHRDTNFTDCPGDAFYAQLPQIAKDVAAMGGPKLYSPLASGKIGAPIRFTGRVSASLPWSVTVVNSSGATVAQGAGTGSAVDWTWDATAAPVQRYSWTMTTQGARPATGTIGTGSVALALQKAIAAPTLVSPGGDPIDDTTTITYTLTAAATVTATLADAQGQVLSTLFSEPKPAGAQTFTFTATPGLLSGPYTIQLVAAANGQTATATVPFTVDDTLDAFKSSPAIFSAAKAAAASITFTLTRGPVTVQLQVKQGETVIATQPPATLEAGPQTLTWNGSLDDGSRAPDGVYTLALSVTTPYSTFTRAADVTLDSTPPTVTAISYKNMRFSVSEPVTLTLIVGTTRFSRTLKQATRTQFWLKAKPRTYRLIATDAAGNATVLRYRLSQRS